MKVLVFVEELHNGKVINGRVEMQSYRHNGCESIFTCHNTTLFDDSFHLSIRYFC